MGSTEIVNLTSQALDMRIGNSEYFMKLATVAKNRSYKLHVDYSDTYFECSMGTDSSGKPVIVSSDECVDNRKIIVQEIDGRFHVEMQPRIAVRPTITTSVHSEVHSEVHNKREGDLLRNRPMAFWRLWIFGFRFRFL